MLKIGLVKEKTFLRNLSDTFVSSKYLGSLDEGLRTPDSWLTFQTRWQLLQLDDVTDAANDVITAHKYRRRHSSGQSEDIVMRNFLQSYLSVTLIYNFWNKTRFMWNLFIK